MGVVQRAMQFQWGPIRCLRKDKEETLLAVTTVACLLLQLIVKLLDKKTEGQRREGDA